MDEFQYQLYLGTIESRKGTKKPLTDLIKELFELKDFYITDKASKFKLITYAVSLSAAQSPLTIRQRNALGSMATTLCNSKSITPIELSVILKYYDSGMLYFRPNSVSELSRINECLNVIGDGDKVNVSFYDVKEFKAFYGRNQLAQLYIQAVYPNSKLLQHIDVKDDISKAIAEVQHFHEVFSTILNHYKELQ